MSASLNEGFLLWNVLIFAINIAALIVTIVKPGKNVQTVRAIAVVGVFSFSLWLGLTSLAWALIDIFFPNMKIFLPQVKKGKR